MKKKKNFTLRFEDSQIEKLKAIAAQEKRTVSAVIRNLVDDAKFKKKRKKE